MDDDLRRNRCGAVTLYGMGRSGKSTAMQLLAEAYAARGLRMAWFVPSYEKHLAIERPGRVFYAEVMADLESKPAELMQTFDVVFIEDLDGLTAPDLPNNLTVRILAERWGNRVFAASEAVAASVPWS